ncbi:MAG TPA: hypothetical protein VNG51_24665 [Ktedonobacteraceae bacterium]|nr:hypothetical protein [Ktedonobacteraceae bacterium]
MANAWDYISKRLVRAHARHFTKWLLKEATFIRQLDNQLQIQSLYADALLEVELHGKRGLLHIEFQSYYDATMALRTLEYNVMASRQYDHIRVYSVVIYLRDKGGVPTSPYVRDFIDERPVHLFFYNVIKLWEIPAESIFQLNLTGLLPLIPLTENGKQPEHVQAMIDRLAQQKEMDLLSISNIIGTLAFTQADEREWFKRRFFMFQDILEDSWMIQEIREEFFNKGIEKGLEQGLEQGLAQERQKELQRFRQMVREVAQMRFSELTSLAEQQAEKLDNPDALQHLTMELFGARDMDEARELLLRIDRTGEHN